MINKIFSKGLQTSIFLFIIFAIHRFFSFSQLSESLEPSSLHSIEALFVGLMSDLWIAACGGVLLMVALWVAYALIISSSKGLDKLTILYQIFFIIIVSLHQSYVQFFKVNIIPFHLSYFSDWSFIKASADIAFKWDKIAFFILLFFIMLVLKKINFFSRSKSLKLFFITLAFILSSTIIHALNIRYRVQWFIPDQLQMNFIEKLHASSLLNRSPSPLTNDEIQFLKDKRGIKSDGKINLYDLLSFHSSNSHHSSIAKILKKNWQIKVDDNEKPIFITILAESFRAVDIKAYNKQSSIKSITPNFDKLSNSGILFSNTWSSGTVTRGGQEAVWCGYPGSVSNSTMRNHPEIKLECIPQLTDGSSFWFHGGEGRFDNQESFWHKKKVNDIQSIKDFPANLNKNGWGISDRDFFKTSFLKILEHQKKYDKHFTIGMLLTLSNHIPWDIPNDTPQAILNLKLNHDSYKTTAYFDFALGEFVKKLKNKNLWNKVIIIVIGDHGNNVKPYFHDSKAPYTDRITKVGFTIIGGIVENSMLEMDKKNIIISKYTSQHDISNFTNLIVNSNNKRFLGESLFKSQRAFPVFSDLGDKIYLPSLEKEIMISDILKQKSFSNSEQESITYYRAMLHLINKWNLIENSKEN